MLMGTGIKQPVYVKEEEVEVEDDESTESGDDDKLVTAGDVDEPAKVDDDALTYYWTIDSRNGALQRYPSVADGAHHHAAKGYRARAICASLTL
jgi:hypothetical protein